jgi:hypothetical protein
MPGTESSLQAAAEIRRRAERFASLRGAQRALSRAVHPRELAETNQQARQLVIRLQELSGRARSSGEETLDREALAGIDAMLDEASHRLLAVLDRIDIAALRSTVPPLLAEHPEHVRGLVDVLAEGELSNDEDMRKLEYLVTLLCTEERDGRRVLVREPAAASARLRQAARERGGSEADADELERRLGDAIARLLHGSADAGAIRDEMRQLKEQSGLGLLHPRVLTAAVAYNVAMSNQVVGLVDGSLSIDRLAEDLLEDADPDAASATSSTPTVTTLDPLGSTSFETLIQAFRGRVTGAEGGPLEARRIVDACALDGLSPTELESFEPDEDDQAARLTRSAVILGLVCRNIEAVDTPLRALGLDPDLLMNDSVARVADEMTGLARKLFADSEYDAAFHLSEIKTRNLAKLASRSQGVGPSGGVATRSSARLALAASSVPSGAGSSGTSVRRLWLGALAVAGLLGAILWLASGWSSTLYAPEDLARVSPFLESGYRAEQAGQPVFVGRLHPSWDYLGTAERREVAELIGRSFESVGVPAVTLSDEVRRRQVEWLDGTLTFLAPRSQ